MNRKIWIGIAGAAAVVVLWKAPRDRDRTPLEDSLAFSTAATAPPMDTVCVEPIQNLSHHAANLDGVEEELANRLRNAGFSGSRRILDAGGKGCEAFINAELVDLSGRGRKTAKIDFRLTLASEQAPRISSSAAGKSSGASLTKFAFNFRAAENAAQTEQQQAEREAISAAIEEQVHQIRVAYQRGLPSWLPSAQ